MRYVVVIASYAKGIDMVVGPFNFATVHELYDSQGIVTL